jgi:hypothetical protein
MEALDDVQPATLDHAAQVSSAIATTMSQEDVMFRPQERVRRNRDQQLARWRQNAACRTKQPRIVVHVFEHVHENGTIDRAWRHVIQVRADHELALDPPVPVVHVDRVYRRIGQFTESARKVQVARSHISVSRVSRHLPGLAAKVRDGRLSGLGGVRRSVADVS